MIDIQAAASMLTSAINPDQRVTWLKSSGYTVSPAGVQTAGTISARINAQIQGLSARDLAHMDGLNIEGVMRSVIMRGNVQGIVRSDSKGGDILQFPETPGGPIQNWRVVQVMETWPTWARVVVVMQ